MLLWSVLVLIFGIVSCFALIQTRTGKDLLVSWASSAVEAGTGITVHIEGLHGLVPFDFLIERAAIGEEKDPWLRVEGFSLKWFPQGLLAGKIHIGRLEALGVEVLRRPPESALKSEPDTSGEAWPVSVPPVLLERFSVDRLFVDGSIIGEDAEFTALGRMTVAGGGETIHGEFSVRRQGPLEERARLRWELNTSPVHLDLDLDLMTADTGILSLLVGVDPGASRLRVSGKGPSYDWQGEMEAETGAWGSIRCGLHADAALDRISLKAEGDFEINESLLQGAATDFPGIGTGGFSLAVSLSEDGVAVIDRLALTMDGMDTEASGAFDIGKGTGELRLDLAVPDLALYGLPGPPVSKGGLHARLKLQGSLDAPLLEVNAEVSGLHAEGIKIGSAKGSFLLRPEQGGGAHFLEGLQVQGRVSDGNLDSDLSGNLRIADRSLKGRVRIRVEDLAKSPFLEESGFEGGGSLTALVKADGISRSVSMDVEGRLQGVGPVPAELDLLVGDGGEFRGSVSVKEGRLLHITDFRAAFPGFDVTVDGNADLMQETGSIKLLGSIPDAGVLSPAAGRPVGGSVSVTASIQGDFRNPAADVEVTVQDLEVDAVSVGNVKATFGARRVLPAPEGLMNIEVVHNDLELAAGADVDVDMPFLRLRDMWIDGAGARVSGGLVVHIPSGTSQGDLSGSLESLARVSALLGVELEGRADFVARLSEEGGAQNVGLELGLDDLSSFAGRARRIEIRGEARDVLRELTGQATIGVQGFQRGDAFVDELAVDVRGGVGAIDVEVAGSGVMREPFRVSSKGMARWSENARVLNLESMKAEFGSHKIILAGPAEIRLLAEKGIETTPLLLYLDSGRLEIEGRMAERIDLTMGFEEIPLTLLSLAGVPEMEGRAAGELRLSGTAREPRAEAELYAEGLRLLDPALRQMPQLGVSSSISLGDGRMEVHLALAEGASSPMKAFLAAPANVSISPMSMDFPRHGEVKGHVEADLDLAPLPLWFSMDGLRLSGRLVADVSLSGSAASPVAQGDLHLHNGTCEVLRSGSIFQEVEAHVSMSQDELTLKHARAVDGSGGEIDAEGVLWLLAEEGMPLEGRLRMNAFHLVRLDELRAVAGGDIKISGSTREADLSGVIRVASAEVRIPDRMPPKIQELEVVEVNETPAEDPALEPRLGEAAPESSSGFGLGLNLDIEIPGRTYVRGRGLDSEWKGALHAGGTAAHPVIRGDLNIVRGHYDFFGERFSLASGSVFLDGSHPPEPFMDVTAERRKAGMTGRVILSGRPSTLSVTVTSDPPMPQDEVMARLLFGRSLTTITPIQALTLARAMDSLAGGKTFELVDRAQRAVGLDRVELVQSDDTEGSTALSVGRYVTEDAYVTVEKGLGTDKGKVSVEYEVTPRITVQTEVGADAAGGVEVKWKWDY